MRLVASLWALSECRTPQGGLAVSYESLGSLWVKLGIRRRRQKTEAGVVRRVETLSAETRADERLEVGQVVRLNGADWAIEAIEPDGRGQVTLSLERRR